MSREDSSEETPQGGFSTPAVYYFLMVAMAAGLLYAVEVFAFV